MNKEKRDNYNLTGSIHTIAIKSPPVAEIDEEVSQCITANTRKETMTSIINVNKLYGDIFKFSEFETALGTILAGVGIDEYSLARVDMRFDSYEDEHYKAYAKLNKYLISALAVTYSVKNTYKTVDLFTQQQLSVAIKNSYFECENYDKKAESGGTDLAAARFEVRSKRWSDKDIREEFTHKWFLRWDKAVKNLEQVHKAYNDVLEQIYKCGKHAYPVRFRSLTDFLIQYQDCIFCKAQMIDLLSRFEEVSNPVVRAENHKKRYGIEYFSKQDVLHAVEEIKRATLNFFGE